MNAELGHKIFLGGWVVVGVGGAFKHFTDFLIFFCIFDLSTRVGAKHIFQESLVGCLFIF